MPRQQKIREIRIRRFGAAIGMIFDESMGEIEFLMNFVELGRLLDAWRVYETRVRKPRVKVMAALDTLSQHCDIGARIRFVAECPIAAHGARLMPVVFEKPKPYPSVFLDDVLYGPVGTDSDSPAPDPSPVKRRPKTRRSRV